MFVGYENKSSARLEQLEIGNNMNYEKASLRLTSSGHIGHNVKWQLNSYLF